MISYNLPATSSLLRPWPPHNRDNNLRNGSAHTHGTRRELMPPRSNDYATPERLTTKDLFTRTNATTQTNASNLQVHDLNMAMSRSFNLEVQTKEGDVVTIAFNEASSNHQNAFEINTPNGSMTGFPRWNHQKTPNFRLASAVT